MRNAIRLLVVNGVAGFLLFVTKLLVVCTSCIIGIVMLTRIDGLLTDADSIASNWAFPLVFMVVFSWYLLFNSIRIVATGVLSIYDMAIDTVFLCFCEDVENNDGSEAEPYFMGEKLRQFI